MALLKIHRTHFLKFFIFIYIFFQGSAGLLALHSAMKMNTSITLMNLDQSCALASSNKVI